MINPKLEVFDPAMCCSTGVCGPSVDPKLVQFASDLKWLEAQGVAVARFNLSQNPAAFVANQTVNALLAEKGESVLPLILVGEKVIASGQYLDRAQLQAAAGLNSGASTLLTPAIAELVAIGAAIAANCEPCLKFHYGKAQQLGVSKADMANAVNIGAMVKDSPHQSILRLADRLTGTTLSARPAPSDTCCCGGSESSESCCGDESDSGESCCGGEAETDKAGGKPCCG